MTPSHDLTSEICTEPVLLDGVGLPLAVAMTRPWVGPGWVEISVSGLTAAAIIRTTLLLSFADGSVVEIALPSGKDGAVTQVLRLEAAVVSARLTTPRPLGSAARATLTCLGRAGVLRRAASRDWDETLRAVYARLLGKKVRARNVLMRLLGQPRQMAYAAWLARNAPGRAAERAELEMWRASAANMPRIEVVEWSGSLLLSLRAGSSRTTPLPRSDPFPKGGEGNSACIGGGSKCAQWIVVLRDGDVLAPDALLRLAKAVSQNPPPVAVTWDSDTVDAHGIRSSPELKPQWNEALYLARDYIGSFAVSVAAVEAGREFLSSLAVDLPDALLLAAVRSRLGVVQHLPRVLVHRHPAQDFTDAASNEARRALVERFVRQDRADAIASSMPGGMTRVSFPVPVPTPLVSLIVATRDRVDLLQPCISGLLDRTAYPALEVLIADNASTDVRTLKYLTKVAKDPRVRVISSPGPFNFAAINNRAAEQARGSVLGFVNNDIQVLGSDWLSEMVGHALGPSIGAVGAKLIYPSGLVQHAGVVLGVGGYAGHAHRFACSGDWGYLGRLQAQQYCAAVTAACLVVERRKFEIVSGFDADAFPVAYNDVDLCLRLRNVGFETFWTPYAELLHKESASRAKDYSSARRAAYETECQRLIERWGVLVADDPYTHPALSRRLENFSLD